MAQVVSLTKSEAVKIFQERERTARAVEYLKKFDVEMVYRLGKEDDTRIDRVRHLEDDRPLQSTNKRGIITQKRNEVITYKENGEVYVLAKSGGVSLFDAMSPKLTLGKKDVWYMVPEAAKIPKDLIIAKDKNPDQDGNYHYSIQPEIDMKMITYQEKLRELIKYMKVV